MIIRNLISMVAGLKTRKLERLLEHFTEHMENMLVFIMQTHSDTLTPKSSGKNSGYYLVEQVKAIPLLKSEVFD